MTSNEVILDLIRRHVLWEGEGVERVREWPDGLALTTRFRHFVAGSEPEDWVVSREEWVDDVVIATRDDLIIHGQSERFGFLLLADGGDIYINDPAAVAELGRRLADGMDPVGYAQLLVQFHPYSSAVRAVVTEPDELRRRFGREDLPDVEPPRTRQTPDGLTLTFSSSTQHARPIVGSLLDLMEWTVTVPPGQPAQWESRLATEGIRLEPLGPRPDASR